MLLTDREIEKLCKDTEQPMISPFVDKPVEEGVISYGLSSHGYDIRLADEFLIFKVTHREPLISPKAFNPDCVSKIVKSQGAMIIKPNQYVLGRSVEYIQMPDDVFAICMNKSTYARCGLIVNITPVEAGWRGYLTIEIANPTMYRIAVFPNEGIAQLLFFRTERPLRTYEDKKGKYQDQKTITLPKVKGGINE